MEAEIRVLLDLEVMDGFGDICGLKEGRSVGIAAEVTLLMRGV